LITDLQIVTKLLCESRKSIKEGQGPQRTAEAS